MRTFSVSANAWIVVTVFVLTLFAPLASATGPAAPADRDAWNGQWPDYMRFINVNNFTFDPLSEIPDIPKTLRYSPMSPLSMYYIVQFDGPITPEMKASLELQGAVLIGYVSYNGFVVRADPSRISAIDQLTHVRWTGAFEPAYKLSPRLSDKFEEMLFEAEERARRAALGTDAQLAFDAESSGKDVAFGDLESVPSPFSKASVPALPSGDYDLDDLKRSSIDDLKSGRPEKVNGDDKAPGRTASGSSITVKVLSFEKDRVLRIAESIRRMGGSDITYSYSDSGMLLATIERSSLALLAMEPGIMWIDRFVQPTVFNDISRWVLQSADSVDFATPVHDHGIWGTGQVVTVGDTGIDFEHDAFEDPSNPSPGAAHRKVTDYYVPPGATGDLQDNDINHGTHVSGTVAGDDGIWHVYDGDAAASNGSAGPHDGQAFDAFLHVQDLSPDGYGVYAPDDFHGLFQPALDRGSWIHTNSWGSVFGNYITEAQQIDDFLWDNQDFLILFAAGNSGTYSGIVSPLAAAKNCIGVGASLNGAMMNDMASFSSRGPAADGRIKPDITAPGFGIWSARGGDPGGVYDDYRTLSGTSMATPNAAGSVALIRQYYMDGFYPTGARNAGNAFTPSAALVKATLINGAAEMTGAGAYANGELYYPNNSQGWGRVLLDDALYFEGDPRGLYVDDYRAGLSTGGSRSYQLAIGDPSTPLDITLVWTDFPGATFTSPALVNNLDLRVTAPDGTMYIGNAYAGRNPGESIPDPSEGPDYINNVEGVLVVADVQVGLWTVEVVGYNVPVGPQPYAVVVSAGIATQRGIISLDKGSYKSDALVTVTVVDTDLNANHTVPDIALAEMTSTTELTPEMVVLTETGPETNVFQGTITLENGTSPVAGDGILQVCNGDLLTAAYYDEDDGLGGSRWVYDTALVDDDPPLISDVGVIKIRFNRATIVWKTDEPASSRMTYGTSTPPSAQLDNPRMVTDHEMTLSGLEENTTYYFAVASTDEAGNGAYDDNSSLYFVFTTGIRPPTIPPDEEWPTFHNNPSRQGVSPAVFSPPLSAVWSDGPHNYQLWNGPVVADGVLVSATLDGFLRARDPYDGTVLWERRLGGTSYYTGTPAVHNGVVYATFYGGAGGTTYALDLSSGSTIWSVGPESGLDFNARIMLAYADGLVFGSAWGGDVFALDAADGSIEWTYQTGGIPFGGPAVDAGFVFIATTDGMLFALDEFGGDLVWRAILDHTATSSPLVAEGKVYIGTYSGTMYAIEEATGVELWKTTGMGEFDVCTPAYDGENIYFGTFSEAYYALNASDGSIEWYVDIQAPVASSPAYANGYLYGTAWDGYLRVIDASDGTIENIMMMGEASSSSPAVYEGWVFAEDMYGTIFGFFGQVPVALSVSPSYQSKATVPSTTVDYRFNVTNWGALGPDTFDAELIVGGLGWSAELFEADGTTPLPDTDADGRPDTGPLSYGSKSTILARVTVPASVSAGDVETTVVRMTSSADVSVHKNATLGTMIPPPGLTIGPRAYFDVLPGDSKVATMTVSNTGAFPDTLDLWTSSEQGWTVQLFEADGVTPLPDTDSDGVPDTGTLAGLSSAEVKVAVDVPGGINLGDFDRVTVFGVSSTDPDANASAIVFLEYQFPPNAEWPTFHNDILRRGASGDRFGPPLELAWSSSSAYTSYLSGPILADGILFTTALDGVIRARDAFNGTLLWQRALGGQYYYTCSPTVADGIVYVVFDGETGSTLYALDERTGQTVWSVGPSSGVEFNARTPLTVDEGTVYGLAWTGEVFAVNASNGSMIWEYNTGDLPWGGTALADGVLFAGTVYGFKALALDQETGELLWSQGLDDSFVSAPVVVQGNVLATSWSGTLYCLDMTDGSVVWSNSEFGGFFLNSPAYGEGTLFVGGESSAFCAVDPSDGSIVWATGVDDPVACSLAYANGYLYGTAQDGYLYALDAASGEILDADYTGDYYATSSPAASNGWVWVESVSGAVLAYKGLMPVGVSALPVFQSKDALPGSTVDFEITVTNMGISGPDTFDVSVSPGPNAWAVELFSSDGLTPLTDTDSDGSPDTGAVDTNVNTMIIARMTVPPSALVNEEDTASLTFTSSNDLNVSKLVRVRAFVPPPGVAIGPRAYFLVQAGDNVSANLRVDNLGATPDTMDITVSTVKGWSVGLFASDGITPLADTDGDLVSDTGEIPGLGHVMIIVVTEVPSDATAGALERVTVRATSSLDTDVSDCAELTLELGALPDSDWPTYQNNMARVGMSPSSIMPPLELQWSLGYDYYMDYCGPAYSDGVLYVTSKGGFAAALDAFSGSVIWTKYFGDWGYFRATPTVEGDAVYVSMSTGTQYVYALNRTTGNTIWATSLPGMDLNQMINLAVHDGLVFGASWNGHVFALNAATGALVWDHSADDPFYQGLALSAGQVLIGSATGKIYSIDEKAGTITWSTTLDGGVFSTPICARGAVFVGTAQGSMYSLDAATGAVLWQRASPSGSVWLSSVAYDGMRIYFGTDTGFFHALDPSDGTALWSTYVGGDIDSSVACAGGYVFNTGPGGYLRVLDAKDGSVDFSYKLVGYGSISAVAISEDWLWVGDWDGRLYAFRGTELVGLRVSPGSQEREVLPGTETTYVLDVTNVGALGPDTFDVTLTAGAHGWTGSLYKSDNMTPLEDTDSDGVPDTGPLPTGGSVSVVVSILAPTDAAPGDRETSVVTFTSSTDPDVSRSATVTGQVPLPGVEIGPSAYLSNDAGDIAVAVVTVRNLGPHPDIFEIDAFSWNSWEVRLFEEDGVTPLPDTDWDGLPDTGVVGGLSSTDLVVHVLVPADALEGTVDRTMVTAFSGADPMVVDYCTVLIELGPGSIEDWPTFHQGADRTGVSPVPFALPMSYSWAHSLEGAFPNWYSPVIWNSTVYGTDSAGRIAALDVSTGALKWQFTLGDFGAFASSPTVAYGSVYVAFSANGSAVIRLYALDPVTGSKKWCYDVPSNNWSYPDTTIAFGSGLVFWYDFAGGHLLANDAFTGELVWSYTFPNWGYGNTGPAFWGGMVFANDDVGQIVALEASTGQEIWKFREPGTSFWAAVAVDNGMAYALDSDATAYAFDAFTGELLWKRAGLGVWASYTAPTVLGDRVFFGTDAGGDGLLTALDAATGEVLWNYTILGGTIYSAPAASNGIVYVAADHGYIHAIDAETGGHVDSWESTGYSMTSIAIGGGYLVVGDDSGMWFGYRFEGVGEPTELVMSPSQVDLEVGGLALFEAVAYDDAGREVSGLDYTWTSLNGLGTVVPSGPGNTTAYYMAGEVSGEDVIRVEAAGLSAEANISIRPGPAVVVLVTPDECELAAGHSQQFSAQVFDEFGNEVTYATVEWSADASIGSITQDGVLTASTAVGTGLVTATCDGVSGSAVVSVVPDALDHLLAEPDSIHLEVTEHLAITVQALDAYGNEITGVGYEWATDIGSVVTIDGVPYMALFVAGTVSGIGTLTISNGTVSVSVDVTVLPGPLSIINVSPSEAAVVAGSTAVFVATGYDAFGNEVAGLSFTWSADASIGSIGEDGMLEAATATGSGTVTAASGTVEGTASVTVVPGTLDHIAASPGSVTMAVAGYATITAHAYDSYGNEIEGLTYTWSSDIGSITPVDGSGRTATFAAGTAAGTGAVTVVCGAESAEVTVSVLPGPVSRIEVDPDTMTMAAGTSYQFEARGYDVFGNEISGLTFEWTADVDAGTVLSSGYLEASETVGSGLVRASVGSVHGEALVTIVPGAIAAITVTPAALTVQVGLTAVLAAFATDAYGNVVSGAAFAAASVRGAVTVIQGDSAYASYTAPTVSGTDTITLTSGTVSKTIQVTVTTGPLHRLIVSPTYLNLKPGEQFTVTVSGVDMYGNPVALQDVDWSASVGVIEVSDDGLSVDFTAGDRGASGYITVEADGLSVTVPVNVEEPPRTLVDDLTSGPTLALMLLVAVLVVLLLYVLMRKKGRGEEGEAPQGPTESQEMP